MKFFLATIVGASVASAQLLITPAQAVETPSTTTGTTPGVQTTINASNTTVEPIVSDRFSIHDLKAVQHHRHHRHHQKEISFTVKDLSTYPGELTTCKIDWKGRHHPRGSAKCDNGWFTVSINYFDSLQHFGLNINHAYGETCVGCNNSGNDDYKGDVGTCSIQLNEDNMTDTKVDGQMRVSTAQRDIECFVDFDDATS